jgi:ribonuclease HIII
MEQRTKAESDPAVAAASILARDGFVTWLEKRSRALGVRLGRGVSAEVKKTAQEIVATKGVEVLEQLAKVHFRTAHEIAPDHFPAPPPRREWRK